LADRIATGRAENSNWSEDEILPWAESKGEYDPEIMNSWLRGELKIIPWREALSKVECPVLLITADTEKGSLVTMEVAQKAPGCKQCE
jgi:hypothetical protein